MDQILEYFGVLTGLLYLFLEIKQHRFMWVVGFVTSLIYVFVFYNSKFYADMGLNIYYVLISIYGFIAWYRENKRADTSNKTNEGEPLLFQHLRARVLLGVTGAFVAIYAILAYGLDHFTDSPMPYGDALTTSLGIVATWMLARRIIEHWLFWVGINAICVYLYIKRGLHPTAFLYFCYMVLAVVGYFNWKKKGTYKDLDA